MNAAARLFNQGVLSRGWVIAVFINKTQLLVASLIMASLVSALGVVYVINTTRTLNANLQQAQVTRAHLHVQWEQLLLEKSTWLMQSRIQNMASTQLDMSIPEGKTVVVVHE
jgi:cell division protein FtsL